MIGSGAAVLQSLSQSDVVKKAQIEDDIPIHTNGHKLRKGKENSSKGRLQKGHSSPGLSIIQHMKDGGRLQSCIGRYFYVFQLKKYNFPITSNLSYEI